MKSIYPPTAKLIFWILATACVLSPVYVHAQTRVAIHWYNKCPDFTGDWTCLNETQAAQRPEVINQITRAVRKVQYKKDLIIYSIDPKRPDSDTWEHGAWNKGDVIEFAAMTGCPNARWKLEKLLKRRK
jgi:hypothetical protein